MPTGGEATTRAAVVGKEAAVAEARESRKTRATIGIAELAPPGISPGGVNASSAGPLGVTEAEVRAAAGSEAAVAVAKAKGSASYQVGILWTEAQTAVVAKALAAAARVARTMEENRVEVGRTAELCTKLPAANPARPGAAALRVTSRRSSSARVADQGCGTRRRRWQSRGTRAPRRRKRGRGWSWRLVRRLTCMASSALHSTMVARGAWSPAPTPRTAGMWSSNSNRSRRRCRCLPRTCSRSLRADGR
mmetsp:Transcript_95592/g.270479  ORF Transcript_95592/g.270479 Transcript_95592/m.270479 type:complete len:249 (-) Transcript_95592:1035-1781(-)